MPSQRCSPARGGGWCAPTSRWRADERALVLQWAQRIEGTPFARVLSAAETELRLQPDGTATDVTIELRQALKGLFPHLGANRIRRAARATLEEALDGLERIVG